MEAHFLLPEMQQCADDYGFLNQHQQTNMTNEFFDTNIVEDIALGFLEDNFTNGEINPTSGNPSNVHETRLSNSSLERHAEQSRREASDTGQISSIMVSNANMGITSEIPAPSPLLSSNNSTPYRQEPENPKSKCPNPGRQSHIMAERMRRERLTERFIALSGLIPGLKKNDKGSVLWEAIKYVKQLQRQVNLLEEQNKKLSGAHPSVVLVKNSNERSLLDEDISNISSNSDSTVPGNSNQDVSYQSIPEVEARVLGKQVIIRIHCKKHKEVLITVLREVDNCHLAVIISNVTPFGNSFVDMTIVAQMEKEDHMIVRILAKNLGLALSRLE